MRFIARAYEVWDSTDCIGTINAHYAEVGDDGAFIGRALSWDARTDDGWETRGEPTRAAAVAFLERRRAIGRSKQSA